MLVKLIKQDAINWQRPCQKIVPWYHFVEGVVQHQSHFSRVTIFRTFITAVEIDAL